MHTPRLLGLLALVFFVLLSADSPARPPSSKGVGYQQVPAPGDGDRTVYGSADTAAPLTYDSNGATGGGLLNICIPFTTMAVFKSKGGEWVGTLTMDPDVSMPLAVDASGACYVTDPDVAAASGRGSCINVANGERLYVAIDFDAVYSRPGARATLCSTAVRVLGDEYRYPPCADNGDCTAIGAGTCVTGTTRTTDELRRLACAYPVGQVDTINTSVSVAGVR
ncbi:MAG: hypothetical protein RMA76_38105 [Deltaproteobacteria bacterium]|jgi:hypothetical protein